MEPIVAITALSALAQDTRLAIFRYLVTQGRQGAAAGDIAQRFHLPKPTLSFHLKELKSAGLVTAERRGRSLIYAADLAAMTALVGYLTENCCAADNAACGPARPLCA
ncbi:MAG: helix-turn-helix transcriptional regulator [Sphingomonadales bacterium]|nr:helix-turn-helix transcriptional regulator [Sphingomonadales bacterium]